MHGNSISKELAEAKGKNFLSSSDFNSQQVEALLNLALQLKNHERRIDLGNRVLGLIFSKPSTRTRVSFQIAMTRLGGQVIDLNSQTSQIGRGEPIKDTARVLSRYCDALAIRTFSHEEIIEYSNWSSIPIINALTDLEHPCQSLADFLTIQEHFGKVKGIKLTYVGDGNNVTHSLMLCGALLGANICIACPKGFEPDSSILQTACRIAGSKSNIEVINDPYLAVNDANVIYTDVWTSMGQEQEQNAREKIFRNFTVDSDLVSKASNNSMILHCLPAHRGEEISDEVFEIHSSQIFQQAENRLHVQQALLATLLGGL